MSSSPFNVVAGVLAVASFACTPSPSFPDAETPVLGTILTEQTLTATGARQEVLMAFGSTSIVVPEGAYPDGTPLVFRVVDLSHEPAFAAGEAFVVERRPGTAFQILPADVAPAVPLRGVLEITPPREPAFDVVHAREDDAGWSAVGPVTIGDDPAYRSFGAPIMEMDAPGLWAVVNRSTDGGL